MSNIKKIIITLLVFAIVALIIDMQGPTPYVRWYFVLPKYGKVLYNNYSIEETLTLAKKNVDKNDLVSGYLLYKNVLKRQPDNIDAYIGIADLYGQAQNFKEAEKYIKEAEKLIKDDTPDEKKVKFYYLAALIYKGMASLSNDENLMNYYINLAVKNFNYALKHLKNIGDKEYYEYIYFNLGNIYNFLAKDKLSLEYYLKAYSVNNSPYILYSISTEFIKLGDYKNAEKYLNLYKEKTGEDSVDLFLGYGYMFSSMGQHERAFEFLDKAKNKDINNEKIYLILAKSYIQMGIKDKAIENYKKAFDMNPFYIRDPEVKKYIKDLNMDIKEYENKIKQIREEKYSQVIKW